MKTTVDFYDFARAFECRPDNFSREGLMVLFEYLDQWEADAGEELELDVIAFCCDFSEDTVEAIASNYSIDLSECTDDDDEKLQQVKDFLEVETIMVGSTDSGSIVYRNF